MEKLFEHAQGIIGEAAKSPLGILALIIMILAVVSVIFFRETIPGIRVGIFSMLFIGASVFAWEVAQVGFFVQPTSVQQQSPVPAKDLPLVNRATIVKLENLPKIPDNATKDNLDTWWPLWLLDFFDTTQIIIDRGVDQGTKKGDHFVVVQSNEIRGTNGDSLGVTRKPGSRIRVVEAQPKFSIAQLDTMAASAADAIDARLATISDSHDLQSHPELVSPVTVGQEVIEIPREEIAWWEGLQTAITNTKEKSSDDEKKVGYHELVAKADAFLQDHPTAYFAPDALFQKAWTLYELQDYPASSKAFEFFLKQYPFHPSASGAREYLQKMKNTKDAAHQQ